MSSTFGLNPDNRIVVVSDVPRGLACNCRCIVCHEPLVARQGTIREHHFAHASGREPCAASHESLLHRYAKQLIAEAGGLMVPVSSTAWIALGLGPTEAQADMLQLIDVKEEQQLRNLRPDLLGHTREGVTVAIEIAYTSFCGPEKIETFAQMELPVLEIDISRHTPDNFYHEAFRKALLEQLEGKIWLWPGDSVGQPQFDATEPDSIPPMHLPPQTRLRLPEEIVAISGRWISIKQFPSGDIAVKVVTYDPDVVSLVKTIAKENFGRYSARWTSWNVPRWRAGVVRAALRKKSESVSIRLHDQ